MRIHKYLAKIISVCYHISHKWLNLKGEEGDFVSWNPERELCHRLKAHRGIDIGEHSGAEMLKEE